MIREVGDEVRAAYTCCSTGGMLLEPVGDDEFAGWWLEDEGTDYGLIEFRLTEDGGLDGHGRADEDWKEDWDVSPVDLTT